MKKNIIIIQILIFVMLFSTSCKKNDFTEIKDYVCKDILYLSTFSSSTKDYLHASLRDDTFTITSKNFTIANKDEIIVNVESPIYIKKEYFEYGYSEKNSIKMDTLSELKVSDMEYGTPIRKTKYTIHDNKNKELEYRFYWDGNKIFIEKFVNNTNNIWGIDVAIIHYTLELGEKDKSLVK